MADKYENKEHEKREHLEYGSEEKQTGQPTHELDIRDHLRTVEAGLSTHEVVTQIDEQESRRILRKIDYRLIPLLSFLHL